MEMLQITSDLSQVATVRNFVASTGRDLGLSEPVVWDLQLAVDEACTNVIKHAYRGQGGKIEITIEPVKCGIRVVVRDWGAPFDPQAVPAPDLTLPLEQRPLGGLGLYLMRELMDQVEFAFDREQGNTLTMVKRTDRRAEWHSK